MESFMDNDVIANIHSVKYDILQPPKNTLIISENERTFCNLVDSYKESQPEL